MQCDKRLIGVAGFAGVGKDTVAQYIMQSAPEGSAVCLALADPLKQALSVWFEVPDRVLYGPSTLRAMQIGDLAFPDGTPITVRKALQLLGTEFGRQMLYQDVWVDVALRRAHHLLQFDQIRTVVITDCRIDNEFEAVRGVGGELWHVTRPGFEAGDHISERDQAGAALVALRTHLVTNNGSLEDLQRTVFQCYQSKPCTYSGGSPS